MLYINKITADPQQQMNLTGIPGVTINTTLRFMPRIQRWIMGFQFSGRSIQGVPVTTGLNILRQFKNNIPFGIACVSASGLDPFDVQAFISQSSNLYLLNSDDIAQIEAGIAAL